MIQLQISNWFLFFSSLLSLFRPYIKCWLAFFIFLARQIRYIHYCAIASESWRSPLSFSSPVYSRRLPRPSLRKLHVPPPPVLPNTHRPAHLKDVGTRNSQIDLHLFADDCVGVCKKFTECCSRYCKYGLPGTSMGRCMPLNWLSLLGCSSDLILMAATGIAEPS